jgi:hypothetical protein
LLINGKLRELFEQALGIKSYVIALRLFITGLCSDRSEQFCKVARISSFMVCQGIFIGGVSSEAQYASDKNLVFN